MRFFPNLDAEQIQRLEVLGVNLDSSYVRFLFSISPEWTLRNLETLHIEKPDEPPTLTPETSEEWVAYLSERPPPVEIPLAVVL